MLLVDDLAAGGTKNLRHTPRGLVTLYIILYKTCQTGKVVSEKMFKNVDEQNDAEGIGILSARMS